SGTVNVANDALLNLVGSSYVELYAPLTNAGTIKWSNTLSWYVYNNGSSSYSGAIYNLAGANFNIQCDESLSGQYGHEFFNNAGNLTKLANSATTTFSVALTNSGAVAVEDGVINFNGGGDLDGSFSAAAGTAIHFSGGNFGFVNSPALTGPGAIQFTGGTLTLYNNVLPGLALVGGTLDVGASFQGGAITNLTSGASLTGSFTVSGVFNSSGGVSGNLVVANGGTLNLSGGTVGGSVSLNSGGGLNWSGGTITGPLSEAGGATINWSGGNASGTVNVANDALLNLVGSSYVELYAPLTNAGTINWSNTLTWYVYNN